MNDLYTPPRFATSPNPYYKAPDASQLRERQDQGVLKILQALFAQDAQKEKKSSTLGGANFNFSKGGTSASFDLKGILDLLNKKNSSQNDFPIDGMGDTLSAILNGSTFSGFGGMPF